jgi:hypothetical protein
MVYRCVVDEQNSQILIFGGRSASEMKLHDLYAWVSPHAAPRPLVTEANAVSGSFLTGRTLFVPCYRMSSGSP